VRDIVEPSGRKSVCVWQNERPSRRADRAPGRGRAGEGPAWRQDLTGRVSFGYHTTTGRRSLPDGPV